MKKNNSKMTIQHLFILGIASVMVFTTLLNTSPSHAQVFRSNQSQNDADELSLSEEDTTTSYEIVEHLSLEDGTSISAHHIISPSVPPTDVKADRGASILPSTGATTLTDFPSYSWVFGCGAVSGAMIAAYHDRNGYPNIYTGPTDGGLMPITDTAWPTWSDGNSIYPSNPLIASKSGLDGRTFPGSIENYWVESGSTAEDPYITNKWTEHNWGDAIGDFMKTSQSTYGNRDGDSTIYRYTTTSEPLSCDIIEENEYYSDLTLGRKQFYEAKGYTVSSCYNQQTDNKMTDGFSLADFHAEIDAGWPVLLHLRGHFVVGYGYSGSTIYIRDTWDSDPTQTYTMTWGEDYLGMDLMSVSIVHLDPPSSLAFPLNVTKIGDGSGLVTSDPAGIDCGDTCSASFDADSEVTLTATADQGAMFMGWSGVCSETAPTCTITMSEAKDVVASFSLTSAIYLPLIINHAGNGTGIVTSDPIGIDCGNTCQATFTEGIQVTLTATPDPGSIFSGWSGACSSTSSTCVVTMAQSEEVTATFSSTSEITFFDVPITHWAFSWIDRLFISGVTTGCASNPLRYCPENQVTRAEMAKFLLKGIHGEAYEPPSLQPNESTGFTDVPWDHWAAAWIKQLSLDEITSGCGGGNYCPEQKVTRAEMAKFLLTALHIEEDEYAPPELEEGEEIGFLDVARDYWAAAWIKQLYLEGITSGFPDGTYGPENFVTRAEMAAFLVRTFNLP